MTLSPRAKEKLLSSGLEVVFDAPLLKRTYWRAGGPADALVIARTLDDVCVLQRIATATKTPLFVLGNASNLLIGDGGIDGIVVLLRGELAEIKPSAGSIRVGGGVKLVVLVSRALRSGWTGLEFFAGIPGTVGGAVCMNAGTHLGEVVDALLRVQFVLPSGEVVTRQASALSLSYRHAELPLGAIITEAVFTLTDGDAATSRATIEHHLARRRATQPVDQPSCGSTFRNPPGDAAGRLIEAAGLKGFQVGHAAISTKHANFIVNLGGATAADIRAVVEHAQAVVKEVHGVELQREVHFVGRWT